jgi:gluconate 2-dehydrogenase gamma chain
MERSKSPKSKGPDKTVASANGNCPQEPQTSTPGSSGNLKRRDLLKVLSSLPAAALVPLTASAGVSSPVGLKDSAPQEKPGVSKGPYRPKVLNEHEWKTISRLSDLIIPADDRSGSATQAGVLEFIDDWLGFKSGDLLAQVRGGLVWLDMECNRGFNRDFVDSTEAEQKQMLDRIAFPKRAAPEDAAGAGFFSILRDLVVSGFFSSEMGVKDLPYLGNRMLSHWDGCPAEALTKLGFSTEGPAASRTRVRD